MRSIVQYKNNDGVFRESIVKQLSNPFYFSQWLDQEHEELRDLAVLNLSGSVHAAFIERFWSRFAVTNSKSRNRMTPKNVTDSAMVAA